MRALRPAARFVGAAALVLAGCTGEKAPDPECFVADPVLTDAAAQPGVATVHWSTSEAGTSVVEWGTGEVDRATRDDGEARTDHAVMVAGAAPGARVTWRVRTVTDTGECVSGDRTWDVPEAVDEVTPVKLVSSTDGFHPGFRLLPLDGSPAWMTIVDDAGVVVWAWETPKGLTPADAFLEPDGVHLSVLELSEDVEDGLGGVYRMSLDRSDVAFTPLPYVHHAFTRLSDGRIAWLRADAREVDGHMVAGDDVMVSEADGTNAVAILSTWDLWTPDVDVLLAGDNHYYPTWLDWTHLNSVSQRADGSLLVSSHKLSVILNVTLDGEVRWTMSGDHTDIPSDFTYSGDPTLLFERAHNPVEVDGGLILFDNGAEDDPYSQAVEYAVDEDARTFEPVWSFHGDWSVERQGDVQRFDDGNTLVNWGSAGEVTEVTPAGDVLWDLSTGRLFVSFSEHHTSIGGVLP